MVFYLYRICKGIEILYSFSRKLETLVHVRQYEMVQYSTILQHVFLKKVYVVDN